MPETGMPPCRAQAAWGLRQKTGWIQASLRSREFDMDQIHDKNSCSIQEDFFHELQRQGH
jgi:hypothetical protein